MIFLTADLEKIKIIKAEISNNIHKKSVWTVFNENVEFFHLTKRPVLYEEHSKWWEQAFEKEYIFLILYGDEICGYIRLSKHQTENKEKHEISIALLKKFQNLGIGTFAYQLFEKEMKQIGISEIIANTELENEVGQKFFEKCGFKRINTRFIKEL